jgi:hypothetical protein
MPSPSKTPGRRRGWTRWLTWPGEDSLVSVAQRMTILLGSMAAGVAVAAALDRDPETGAFSFGLPAAIVLLLALEVYYRRRYRPGSGRRDGGG